MPEQENRVSQKEFQGLLQTKLREAVRFTLMTILDEEVEGFIGAGPYQRTTQRRDYRNGTYSRELGTGLGVIEDLVVPRTRKGFRTQVFERYQRRRAELDEAITDMFVGGVSTARVGEVVNALSGVDLSPSTVSRIFHSLDEEFESWKSRPLQKRYLLCLRMVLPSR